MNPSNNAKKAGSRAWMGFWGFSLVIPFFTSWSYCSDIWHDGGLSFHPEYPLPIYVMSGLAVFVAVCAVLFSGLKWWAKSALCVVSIGLQVVLTGLGMLVELYCSGLGYNGG